MLTYRACLRLVLALVPLIATPAVATQPLTGYQIAERAEQNNRDYKSQRVTAEMTLIDASGKPTVTYKMMQFTKEGAKDEGAKSLIRFVAPADTQGTALLAHESLTKEDDRWLYLSETRQMKRIAGSSKSASFKGSEISYEDLTVSVLDRYDWKLLKESTVDNRPVYEVERVPRFESSGYSRAVVLFDKEHFYPVQLRFFDRANQPLKVAMQKEYKQYNGKWRAQRIEVTNLQTKRRTHLAMTGFQLGAELPDSLFSKSQLEK